MSRIERDMRIYHASNYVHSQIEKFHGRIAKWMADHGIPEDYFELIEITPLAPSWKARDYDAEEVKP
jgi:hypothetical protein